MPRARPAPRRVGTPGPERADVIREIAKLFEAHHGEFEEWLIREGGSVLGKAEFEVGLLLSELWEAAALSTQSYGHLLLTSEAGQQHRPLRAYGVIGPWLFPQILSIRAVAPVQTVGSSFVLRPDIQTGVR